MKSLTVYILYSLFWTVLRAQAPHKVYPNATDSNINTFTTSQHYCYAPVPAAALNKLLIFLPGTQAQPSGCEKWMLTAQEQGFHVIGLYYPNTAIDSQYDTLSGWEWINQYAYEVIFGADRSPAANVNYSNCIENRLFKCLKWLSTTYPTEGWAQYFQSDSVLDDSIIWSKCIFSGHSLGGNFAGCIGKFRCSDRIICVSSPRVVPEADWDTFQTPRSSYRFFWHNLDKAHNNVDQYTIIQQMGVTDPVRITEQTDPGSWGHVLKTIYQCPPSKAHKIVISDNNTPVILGIPYYKSVWIHLMKN